MEEFRFKVVRQDGSHYFYSPSDFITLKEAFFKGFIMATSREDVKEVHFYIETTLIATFYH